MTFMFILNHQGIDFENILGALKIVWTDFLLKIAFFKSASCDKNIARLLFRKMFQDILKTI